MERSTVFSKCRKYRYTLWRQWDFTNPSYAMFIGLNPSTADEVQNDPTVARCIDYSMRWGFGALCMMNIFSFRATLPTVMKAQPNPVGKDNNRWLVQIARDASVIVAAWGTHGSHLNRHQEVIALLGDKLHCLKETKDGFPSHPLYLKKSLLPVPYIGVKTC